MPSDGYTKEEFVAGVPDWPDRGVQCERCRTTIPKLLDLSAETRRAVLDPREEGDSVGPMRLLEKETGAPPRYAKIWVLHEGVSHPRFSGPPCPSCGGALASEARKAVSVVSRRLALTDGQRPQSLLVDG
jgi:hypothetical protein